MIMEIIKNGEKVYDLQAMYDREAKSLKPEQIGLAIYNYRGTFKPRKKRR